MKKSVVIHQKTHMPPPWRGTWWATSGIPVPSLPHGGTVPERAGGLQAERWLPSPRVRSLNCSLRRYVPTSSLRVWLTRRGSGTGDATAPGGRDRPSRVPGRPAGAAGCVRPPSLRERSNGVSRPEKHTLGYRASRNRQMEHLVQAVVSLRGGVRRGSAITRRERADLRDLLSTTLSNNTYLRSNIFGFVMT